MICIQLDLDENHSKISIISVAIVWHSVCLRVCVLRKCVLLFVQCSCYMKWFDFQFQHHDHISFRFFSPFFIAVYAVDTTSFQPCQSCFIRPTALRDAKCYYNSMISSILCAGSDCRSRATNDKVNGEKKQQ